MIKKILIGLGIIAIVGYVGFNYWKTTPEYSLLQIQSAIETKDVYLFKKYVDVENILEHGIDDILEAAIKESKDSLEEDSLFDTSLFAKGMVELIKPAAISYLRKEIDKYIEEENNNKKVIDKTIDVPILGGFDSTKFKSSLGSTRMSYLTKENKVALLGLEFVGEDGDNSVIEFRLRKYEDFWRITEMTNLEEILDSLQ